MVESSKPRKQRKHRYSAPLHIKRHFVRAHLSKEARDKSNVKRRSAQVAKGDTVKIMRGGKRGTTGKVARVDINRGFLYLENVTRKNARGREFQIPIRPSNVYITELNLSDKLRSSKLLGSGDIDGKEGK